MPPTPAPTPSPGQRAPGDMGDLLAALHSIPPPLPNTLAAAVARAPDGSRVTTTAPAPEPLPPLAVRLASIAHVATALHEKTKLDLDLNVESAASKHKRAKKEEKQAKRSAKQDAKRDAAANRNERKRDKAPAWTKWEGL